MEPSVISSEDYVMLRSLRCSLTKHFIDHKVLAANEFSFKVSWTVTALWILLSTLVAFTCTIGFVETEWFVRENTTLSGSELTILRYDRTALIYTLGMFNVCYRDFRQTVFHCHHFAVTRFPSLAWQGTCLLYGTGCVLQGCAAVILVLSLFQKGPLRRLGVHLVSYAHMIAGFLQTISLLLYPMILDTHVGHLHCGLQAQAYGPDHCRIGWAYVASTAGTLLTFYCPFLAYFSFYKVYSRSHDGQKMCLENSKAHSNPNFLL
ncbi:LHFPL tetraspan subfamily member 2 protein-like [Stegodyphus dumicola]|uniref:LHFPL tetraspan subfamily member 2 protein-like n=1 Tax=Stegodyphus dumicola TaxID=202533 RepID=UPI0015AAD9BC|nr:LHFPL tetraspan subfamily member 2 protein-like [Stegodyphus dumicola]